MSICPEPAGAVMGGERQIRRNGWTCDPFSWGSVEQALHSRHAAEALLFHGNDEAVAYAIAFFVPQTRPAAPANADRLKAPPGGEAFGKNGTQ